MRNQQTTAAAPRASTVQEVSQRYGVGEHTVLGWIASGQLRAIHVGRRPGAGKPRWRITPEALAAFEQVRTSAPPAAKLPRRKRPEGVIEFYPTA